MRKFIIPCLCGILFSFKSYALPYPELDVMITVMPDICGGCTAEQLKAKDSAITIVKEVVVNKNIKGVLDETKAHAEKYAKGVGKDFLNKAKDKFKKKGGEEEKPVSYARTIKQTKTPLTDVLAVKEMFKKYFLYYPSANEEVQASYREKREQFIEDTTLELYISAKEMDEELKVMLSQLDVIEKCMIADDREGCKAADMEEFNCQKDDGTEDEMCYRRNALMVAEIYDEIMKQNEYLMAMRAQYEAVRAIGQGVKPKPYTGKKKETSQLSTYLSDSKIYASEEIEENELILEKLPDSKFDFADNNNVNLETPLAGKEGDFKALEVFSAVEDELATAMESHNLKQQLPSMKGVFDNYHNMEKMHQKAAEALKNSQTCVLNYLSKRYGDSQKVWFDNCSVDEKDGYVCSYSPAKGLSDKSESEGVYDVLCPNNPAQKCYKLAASAYNEVGGMSGWLINMYLNAKDELSDSDVKEDDYVLESSTSEAKADPEMGPETNGESVKNYKYQVKDGEILSDKYLEKMRVLGRLNVSIGALANAEINKDVTSGKSKFGVNTKPFPLWNDQMNFYNQYVDGKYENIRKYFLEAPLFKEILSLGLDMNETYEYEPEVGPNGVVTKTVEKIREEVAEKIGTLLESITDDESSKVDQIEAVLKEEKEEIQTSMAEFDIKLAALEKDRIDLYRKLENINIKQADLHADVESKNSVINYAENYNEQAEHGVEVDEQYHNPKNPHETFAQKYEQNIGKQSQLEKSAESARKVAENSLAASEDSRDDILNKIKDVEAAIENIKSERVLAYHNAKQKYKTNLDKIVEDDTLSDVQQNIVSALADLTVLGEAEELIENMREYAAKKVDEATEKLSAMKNNNSDSLYYAQNNAKVVGIHTDMLKSITEPEVSDVISELELGAGAAELVTKYAENLSGVFANVCDKVNCYQPDNQYFVGLVAQEKDLAAPKAPVDFSSAPLREIFSMGLSDFTYIDSYAAKDFKVGENNEFVSVDKTDATDYDAKVLLTENSLLESGIELPEIWKMILSYRPFVQKDLDLEKLLNHDEKESFALARSGMYPCLSGSRVIDVIPDTDGKVKYAEVSPMPSDYGELKQCQTIVSKDGKYIDMGAASDENKVDIAPAQYVSAIGASELGNILEIAKVKIRTIDFNGLPFPGPIMEEDKEVGYLTFRKELLNAMRFLVKYTEKFEDGEEIKFSSEYNMYKRILPQNSQFGDYLAKMDLERAALEGKDKLRNNIYSNNVDDLVIVNTLYKSFAAMGYDFDREKFDLSDENYYKQAENVLNARKEDSLRKAKALLENSNLKLTMDEMKKRYENLAAKIALLEQDADETVTITGTETSEELAEKIKTEKTDKAILDKEVEKGNEYFNEKIEHEEPAYCSVYVQ